MWCLAQLGPGGGGELVCQGAPVLDQGGGGGQHQEGAARRGTSWGGVPARSTTAVGRSDILVINTAAASTSDFVIGSISIMEHLFGILLTLKSSFPSLTGIVGKPN